MTFLPLGFVMEATAKATLAVDALLSFELLNLLFVELMFEITLAYFMGMLLRR